MNSTTRKTNTARIARAKPAAAVMFLLLIAFALIPFVSAEVDIFPNEINERIKVYELVEEKISIKNKNAVPITGLVSLEGNVSDFVTLSTKSTTIQPGSEGEISLDFFGKGANESRYEGVLVITGDVQERIPLVFETYGADRVQAASLVVDVSLLQPIIVRGESLKFKTDILNLLSEVSHDITVEYAVFHLQSNQLSNISIFDQTRNVSVQQSYSEVNEIQIPEKAEIGDYILRTVMHYDNQTSTTDTLFTVRQHFYQQNLFGVLPVWFFSLLMTLMATGYMSYKVYKKQKDSKKRFHVKVEYDELPPDGDRSLYVGKIAETSKKTYFDMDRLTVHTIVAGSTGGGKSISAQDIVEEALLKGVAVAVFDPTAQWSGMLRKLEDKKFLEFYPQFGLDPKKSPRAFNGNIKAVKNGREIIDIFKYMRPGEIQIFTTNTLDPKDY
ncbi:ATP-binding protein, partial [Candidatus Woesearchaeota archaeon]|nr:ATP-binding protein [Candidatus Woesearchaeota archaeon]